MIGERLHISAYSACGRLLTHAPIGWLDVQLLVDILIMPDPTQGSLVMTLEAIDRLSSRNIYVVLRLESRLSGFSSLILETGRQRCHAENPTNQCPVRDASCFFHPKTRLL
jgi:hypothetical protein